MMTWQTYNAAVVPCINCTEPLPGHARLLLGSLYVPGSCAEFHGEIPEGVPAPLARRGVGCISCVPMGLACYLWAFFACTAFAGVPQILTAVFVVGLAFKSNPERYHRDPMPMECKIIWDVTTTTAFLACISHVVCFLSTF